MCSLIQLPHHVDTTSAKTASISTGKMMSSTSVPCVRRFSTQDLSCKSIFSSLRWLLSSDNQLKRKTTADQSNSVEKAAGLQVYNILRQLLERGLSEITESVEEKQRKTQEQAKGFITELEQELFALMKRSDELKQLSHSEDDLDFLQTFPLLTTVRKAMETANRYLVLSNDEKQVRCVDLRNHLPDNTERFSYWGNVLGRHGYSSGRFYYEVQVTGKTEWYLGVARKSVDRKASSPMSPQNGYWKVHLKDNEYKASDDPPVSLSLKSKPKKVGVFVDYEEGLVSFYDTDAIDLIYSFTGCSFTERLYPFLNPCIYDGGKNSAPLIITSVTSTK
uniref:B30.2/SPRY domain-containing protein n=1 Tax=Lates calcarifer TaxID=8187 RepID=A0A4W6C2H9_LATCA